MNIALVGTLEAASLLNEQGEVDLALIRASIEAHLDCAPMLRRVLKPTRLGQGGPVWTDAADFAIAQHVVLAQPSVPIGLEQGFLDWCARETIRPLDRSKPLWRITIVPGLPNRRLGFLLVAHHVVADGLRGVDMIAHLLDVDPVAATTVPKPWRPAPSPTAAGLIADNVRSRVNALRSLRPARLRRRLAGLHGLRGEIPARSPATVLTGSIGYGRQLAVLREPLEGLRVAAHHLQCTINDLLLAAVTQGLREVVRRDTERDEAMTLRATVPVGELNRHKAGMIAVALPVGVSNPGVRLRRIVSQTSVAKRSPDGGVAGIVSLPASLARVGVLWARHTAATHINLYVTNVPGPPFPLYLAGAALHDVVPLAPLVAGVRLSVTALSYDGTLSIALLADDAVTDFPALADGMRAGLDGYLSQVRVGVGGQWRAEPVVQVGLRGSQP